MSFVSFLIPLVAPIVRAAVEKLVPQAAAYIKEGSEVVIPIVQAAEATGAPGAEKKAQAVTELVDAMHKLGFDPPGTIEDHLADALVEGAVLILKEKGGDFFGGLVKALTP